MSTTVLPSTVVSVGPPSLDYLRQDSGVSEEKAKMESRETESLIESLTEKIQNLKLLTKDILPKKTALDDVDGLVDRGVNEPTENDETTYPTTPGSQKGPSSVESQSMSPPYKPTFQWQPSPGCESSSLQEYRYPSPMSHVPSGISSPYLARVNNTPYGYPSPDQSTCIDPSAVSQFHVTNQNEVDISSLGNDRFSGHAEALANLSSMPAVLRGSCSSVSSQSSVNRSSTGSEDSLSKRSLIRGRSVLDDFMQMTNSADVTLGENEINAPTGFVGAPAVALDLHSMTPVPVPAESYMYPGTNGEVNPVVSREEIFQDIKATGEDFLRKNPPNLQSGGMNSSLAGTDLSTDSCSVCSELPFGGNSYGDQFLGAPAVQVDVVSTPARTSVPASYGMPTNRFPAEECRTGLPGTASNGSLGSGNQMFLSMPGKHLVPEMVESSSAGVLAPLTVEVKENPSSPHSCSGAKRPRDPEPCGPRKNPKLRHNDWFKDPEDPDLHVIAHLDAGLMQQHMDVVLKVLQHYSSCLDDFNLENKTPLYVAVENDNVTFASLLLDQGANANISCSDKNRLANEQKIEQGALHLACEKGNLELVELLLDNGANVNMARVCDGHWTPIMVALQGYAMYRNGNYFTEIILTLIRRGADLSLTEKLNKKTALMMAVEMGDERLITEVLEEIGAGNRARNLINAPNGQGNTCLHIVAGRQHHTLEDRSRLMKILIKFGGDTNVKNREGFTPNDLGGKGPMRHISSTIQSRMNRGHLQSRIPNLNLMGTPAS